MATLDYQINGVSIPCPTNMQWQVPPTKGIRGDGMKLYDPYYSIQLQWNYLNAADFTTLVRVWKGLYNSGTSVIRVPEYGVTPYVFKTFSGVFVDQPEPQSPLEFEYYSSISMTIRKVNIG